MAADNTVAPGIDIVSRAPSFRYLEWGPVILGAIGAAAISFILYTFGSALGLAAASPYPYRGLSATTFFVIAGLYAGLAQVVSYAAGGYLAGRMRTPAPELVEGEQHFRDGAHGFAVWAVGLLLTAVVVASGASGALKTATEATATASAGATAGTWANPMNRLSMEPSDTAVDLLLRPSPDTSAPPSPATAPAGAPSDTMQRGATMDREPLVRLITASLKSGTLAGEERAYLAQVVARQTGLPPAEAEKRVDAAYGAAKNVEQKVRDAANEARKKAALAAFITAATLAVALAAACAAAALGSRDRDTRTAPYWMDAARFW
jgi:hypothetical protein